jgi:hypothetical protein
MEVLEFRGLKKAEKEKMDSATLKAILTSDLMPSVIDKERGLFGRQMPFGYDRWSNWLEAVGETEILKGLRFADELSEVRKQVDDLSLQVVSVTSELKQCKEGISRILNQLRARPITKQTELFEIDGTLEVIRPIPVAIKEYSDEVIAAFPEIGAFGAGLCEAEAIINLKKEIRKIFFELEGVSDNKLGKLPLTWKRVLLKVVRKIGNSR